MTGLQGSEIRVCAVNLHANKADFYRYDHNKNVSKQRISFTECYFCCFQLGMFVVAVWNLLFSQRVDPVQYHLRTSYMPSPVSSL